MLVDTTPRVSVIHAQTRPTLAIATAFAVAAPVAAVVPHRTGVWLPLHLFLVGGLLLAISGATRLFAVTWSAGEPANPSLATAQRWSIGLGAAGLAVGRELSVPTPLLAGAGLLVTAGLVLLGILLVREVHRGKVRRFHPALHFYLAAIAAGIVGTVLGAAMVTGGAAVRDAHLVVNVLGLVGLVIAGTLPFFTATLARLKMATRATPARLHLALGWFVGGLAVAVAGELTDRPALAGIGLAAYAVGIGYLVTLLPSPGRKQLRWAGPRLVQLGVGVAWWIGTVAVAALRSIAGRSAWPESLLVALVVGGYAQILVASLAYLAPVLRGGGHERLTDGFATTRSWTALAAANAAAVAWVAGRPALAVAALGVLAVDVATRARRLARD